MKKDVIKKIFKKILKKIFLCVAIFSLIIGAVVIALNLIVILYSSGKIKPVDELGHNQVDCILVLGAAVKPDGAPSAMLSDRLDKAVELYEAKVSDNIIVSGDHREKYYDEVNTMKNYLIEKGIPSQCIFMDHAGLSTYDSMYRAANIFGVKKAVIVTQKYHLYRAIYDAKSCGIEAYGASAKEIRYAGQVRRDIREIAARLKDFAYGIIKPNPEIGGEPISLDENGDITND